MKKRRILLGLALASLFTFSLSACDDANTTTTPTTTENGGSNSGSGTTNGGQTGTGEGQGQTGGQTGTGEGQGQTGGQTGTGEGQGQTGGQTGTGEGQGQSGSGEGQGDPVVETCKVQFYSNGGTAVATATVNKGEKLEEPTAPRRTSAVHNHEFAGWFTDAACTTAYDFDAEVNGDVTLYAKWTSTLVEATNITMNGTEYATISAALAAIPTNSTDTYTIILPKNTYNENALTYNGKATIKIVGATDAKYGSDVIIKGRGSNMGAEKTRELIEIQGSATIILENLTLESDYLRSEHTGDVQAEVLGTDTTGYTMAYNCSFKSHQDTLRTAGKAWFYGCYIEGDTDFIWMEQAGKVALYENCEIVSVYDEYASSHTSYLTAPRMTIQSKVGKGLVIYNSNVREQNEAQTTYLARTPWSSGYYNQVAYINTTCTGIEASVWYKSQIATEFDKTIIGWKMDAATADSINYAGNNDIVDETTVSKEFNGRKSILNRIYNTGKQKYEKDTANNWDIDAAIIANGWAVAMDSSSDLAEDEIDYEVITYNFDGTEDQSALCNGFAKENGDDKLHYKGASGSTITIPLDGKCYVEVYGYYQGTVEAVAGSQGLAVLEFNNGTTKSTVDHTYAVYDADATSLVLTAKAQTYITKIVVIKDTTAEFVPVTSIDVAKSTNVECVGVSLTLSETINPKNATNKSVKWSSSDTDVADINEYTGVVTFKSAGEVTFTATACDGSGITKSVVCNPIAATWTAAEFYIAKDGSTITGENSSNFTMGDLYTQTDDLTTTFKNLAGQEISTNRAAKMNGGGYVAFATTKEATVTIVMANRGKNVDAALSITGAKGETATLISQTGNSKYPTFVYRLSGGDSWRIQRAGTSELNVIEYVKVEYDAVWDFATATPSSITGVNIQGTTGEIVSNHSEVKLTVDATCTDGKLAYNASGYAQFNSGTIIRVPVKNVDSVITTVSYSGQSKYTIGTGAGAVPADTSTDEDKYTVTAADVEAGYVEIVATGGAYIYSISLTNPR